MTIEQDLQRFISNEVVLDAADRGEVQPDELLLSTGRVDSLGLLQILSYIDEHYGVALLQRGEPKNFESVRALAEAIRRATATKEA